MITPEEKQELQSRAYNIRVKISVMEKNLERAKKVLESLEKVMNKIL